MVPVVLGSPTDSGTQNGGFPVPKKGCFGNGGFPYISCMDNTAYIGDYLHFRYLKFLVIGDLVKVSEVMLIPCHGENHHEIT